ncbi:hypothetical protein AC1031_005291 [Aphanomyces cochlioides]|nr:hypothetical protein AC1031_005291 [Aphanomyces cochlioides]
MSRLIAPKPPVPPKETIHASFLSSSTHRQYKTYQTQFEDFCLNHKNGLSGTAATPDDCTDFLHYLFENGRKSRTIDAAKNALVSFYKQKRITPNPAQDITTKHYVVGLQKYNRRNDFEDEKKAHPLSVFGLSTIMNSFANVDPFVGAMISEMLGLKWSDVSHVKDESGEYLSVRLRWHKKASVEKECQVYNLVDEMAYPCLKVCAMYSDYISMTRSLGSNVPLDAFLFPNLMPQSNGSYKLDWFKCIEQNQVRSCLKDIVASTSNPPITISLHSMRRGGCFFRVFESTQRRFDFRELMAWCRWSDAKTCCEYLITQSIVNDLNPRNLLRSRSVQISKVTTQTGLSSQDVEAIVNAIVERLKDSGNSLSTPSVSNAQPKRQRSMQSYVSIKTIPSAHSAREAWDQWFTPNAKAGLYCPLKDFTKQMVKADRKKYSEDKL